MTHKPITWDDVDEVEVVAANRGRPTCRAPAQTRNRYAVLPGATNWIFSGLAFIRPHSGS